MHRGGCEQISGGRQRLQCCIKSVKSENTQSVPAVSKLQSEAKPSPNVLADCFGVPATSILYRNVTKNASPNLRGNTNSARPAKRVEALAGGPPVVSPVNCRIHIVYVLLVQLFAQLLHRLTEALEMHDLTRPQELDDVVDIRVV